MKKYKNSTNKPVPKIVNAILEDARKSHTDGPTSALHGYRAQLSTTLNQAGTLLAKLDRADPPRKPSVLQSVLSSISSAKTKPQRRSWFFASAGAGAMPTARRIEQLLKASAIGGSRLVLDAKPSAQSGQASDMHCVLPAGATDPVCEPRS
jgi:hypothetical protein